MRHPALLRRKRHQPEILCERLDRHQYAVAQDVESALPGSIASGDVEPRLGFSFSPTLGVEPNRPHVLKVVHVEQQPSVRRPRDLAFVAKPGGDPPGVAAIRIDDPQIPAGRCAL